MPEKRRIGFFRNIFFGTNRKRKQMPIKFSISEFDKSKEMTERNFVLRVSKMSEKLNLIVHCFAADKTNRGRKLRLK